MKTRTLFLTLLFYLAVVFVCQAEDKQYLLDRVAAVVNNDVITQSEFDAVFRPIYDQVKQAYQGADLNRELQEMRIKLLKQLIEDKLVYQEAKKMGIEVTDSEVREEMASFQKHFPDEATFQRKMDRERIQIKDVEQRFRERIAIEKFHQYLIRGNVIISPNEAEQY